MDLENGVDTQVLDWLSKDLFVELHHTRPVIKPVKQEDEETIVMEVSLQNGVPASETTVIGVSTIPQ
jgi:hypothetical protein